MNRPKFDFRKIILIISAVVVFLLVMDLNTRLSELFRLTHERNLARRKSPGWSKPWQPECQLEYAKSDKAVRNGRIRKGIWCARVKNRSFRCAAGRNPMPILEPTPTRVAFKTGNLVGAVFWRITIPADK